MSNSKPCSAWTRRQLAPGFLPRLGPAGGTCLLEMRTSSGLARCGNHGSGRLCATPHLNSWVYRATQTIEDAKPSVERSFLEAVSFTRILTQVKHINRVPGAQAGLVALWERTQFDRHWSIPPPPDRFEWGRRGPSTIDIRWVGKTRRKE